MKMDISKAGKAKRVDTVRQMIKDICSREDILNYLTGQGYTIKSAVKVLEEIYIDIRAEIKASEPNVKNEWLLVYQNLAKEFKATGSWKNFFVAAERLNKILGLDAPVKTENSLNITISDLTKI